MQTIERLCKYKDVANIVYKCVHQLLTKELISELNVLQSGYYYADDDIFKRFPERLLYIDDSKKEQSLFNWRTPFPRGSVIYKVNHKNRTYSETNYVTSSFSAWEYDLQDKP